MRSINKTGALSAVSHHAAPPRADGRGGPLTPCRACVRCLFHEHVRGEGA